MLAAAAAAVVVAAVPSPPPPPRRPPFLSVVLLWVGAALLLTGGATLVTRDGGGHPSVWALLHRLNAAPLVGEGGGGDGDAAAGGATPPLAAPPPGAAWRDPSAPPLQSVTSDWGPVGGRAGRAEVAQARGLGAPLGEGNDTRADAGAQSRNLYSVVDMSTSHAPEGDDGGGDGVGGGAWEEGGRGGVSAGGAAGSGGGSGGGGGADGKAGGTTAGDVVVAAALPPRPCQNTVTGPEYVTDDRGYTCTMETVRTDQRQGCCATAPTTARGAATAGTPASPPPPRYGCATCDAATRCCVRFDQCVSCCMDPALESLRTSLQAARSFAAYRGGVAAAAFGSPFAVCAAACRSSSRSVVHENAYRSAAHHCYGGEPPAVEPDLHAG
ncbi:hypothetical protein MMPV_002816 [Pyropia vietnamensis]